MENRHQKEFLQNMSRLNDYAEYMVLIETEFSNNHDAEAFRLATEAKQKGFKNSFFDYVIGYCYNNGKGNVSIDKKKAGHFYFASAESKDNDGKYYNNHYSNESRAVLVEDYIVFNNQYNVIDLEMAIKYCNLLLSYGYSVDDVLLYLTIIYCDPQYGCLDIDKSIKYCDMLMNSSNPDSREKAASIMQSLVRERQESISKKNNNRRSRTIEEPNPPTRPRIKFRTIFFILIIIGFALYISWNNVSHRNPINQNSSQVNKLSNYSPKIDYESATIESGYNVSATKRSNGHTPSITDSSASPHTPPSYQRSSVWDTFFKPGICQTDNATGINWLDRLHDGNPNTIFHYLIWRSEWDNREFQPQFTVYFDNATINGIGLINGNTTSNWEYNSNARVRVMKVVVYSGSGVSTHQFNVPDIYSQSYQNFDFGRQYNNVSKIEIHITGTHDGAESKNNICIGDMRFY